MKKYAIIIFICSVSFVACATLNTLAEINGNAIQQVFTGGGMLASSVLGVWLFITKIIQQKGN